MTLQTIIDAGIFIHGAKFDASDLMPAFAPYYGNRDLRVTVKHPIYGRRTGWIGRTTGGRPAFLLMPRANSCRSSDVLGPEDRIVAVRRRRA